VPPIQCRNRKDVHECQNDRENRSQCPELLPIPDAGESISDTDHTTQRFAGIDFAGKDLFDAGNITIQGFKTFVDT